MGLTLAFAVELAKYKSIPKLFYKQDIILLIINYKTFIIIFKRFRTNVTSNEIKYIIKVIKSSEKRGILLKGTTRKSSSQEEGFLNFLRLLMPAGLPLMKNVFIS